MKIIFIAGPFRGDGAVEAQRNNVETARKYVDIFINNDIPYYSPHMNIDCELIGRIYDANKLSIELNREMLDRTDAVAILPNWENSKGTIGEINRAEVAGKKMFYLEKENAIEEIKNWLKV
jgi:hypothetical protein